MHAHRMRHAWPYWSEGKGVIAQDTRNPAGQKRTQLRIADRPFYPEKFRGAEPEKTFRIHRVVRRLWRRQELSRRAETGDGGFYPACIFILMPSLGTYDNGK